MEAMKKSNLILGSLLCCMLPLWTMGQSLTLAQKKVAMDIADELVDNYIKLCDFRALGDATYSDAAGAQFVALFDAQAQICNDICPAQGNEKPLGVLSPTAYAERVKRNFPAGLKSVVVRVHYDLQEMDRGRILALLEKEVSGETAGKEKCVYQNRCTLRLTISFAQGLDSFRIQSVEAVTSALEKVGCDGCELVMVQGGRLIYTSGSTEVVVKGPVRIKCGSWKLGEYDQVTVRGGKISVVNDTLLKVSQGVQVVHEGRVVHDYPHARGLVQGSASPVMKKTFYIAPNMGYLRGRLAASLPDDSAPQKLTGSGVRIGADLGFSMGRALKLEVGLSPAWTYYGGLKSSDLGVLQWVDSACGNCVVYGEDYLPSYRLEGVQDTVTMGLLELPLYVGGSLGIGETSDFEVYGRLGLGCAIPLKSVISSGALTTRSGWVPSLGYSFDDIPKDDPVESDYGVYHDKPLHGSTSQWLGGSELFGMVQFGGWWNWTETLAVGFSGSYRSAWVPWRLPEQGTGTPEILDPQGNYTPRIANSTSVSYSGMSLQLALRIAIVQL
jgi:hypothetical protein